MVTSLRSDPLPDALGLPPLTSDMEEAKEHLARYGLARIRDALAPDEVAALLGRLQAQAEAEREAGVAFLESGGANQRVWNLPSKGQGFRDLLTKPLVREFAHHLLGDYSLSSHTANIAGPGGDAMVLHSDQGYVPRSIDMPLTINVMWMLVDFTEDNGATRMVPGSHLIQSEPPAEAAARAVAGVGPAGTALVFDGRIWHGTGANVTAGSLRYGVLTYFCRPWIRPQENYTLSTHPDVLAAADPEVLQLLGFRVWRSLGGVQGPWGPGTPGPTRVRSDGFVQRPTSWIGEMQP
jgi:ectoine hydroxylase-related dioxygenase (phytanoyl-CoA dioxygenase family)